MLSDAEMHRLSLRLKCFSVVDEERLKQCLRMASTSSNKYKVHQTENDVEADMSRALGGIATGWMV